MKILLVAPMVPAADGGGAIPVLLDAEVAGLSERNEVTLVTAVGEEPGEARGRRALLESGLDAHVVDRRQPARGRARRWRRRRGMAGAWAGGGCPGAPSGSPTPASRRSSTGSRAARRFDVIAVEDSSMSGFRLPAGVPTVYTQHEVLRPRPLEWPPGAPARLARLGLRRARLAPLGALPARGLAALRP